VGAIRFLRNFVARPVTTGAVVPSSNALAELITDAADVQNAKVVIEFGTGTGVFTEKIVRKLPRQAQFFAIEINPDFARLTRERCPTVTVHEDSAVNAVRYLKSVGHAQCDSIVCGLPWASFPEDLQDDLLHTVRQVLKPGGALATFAYLQGVLLPAGQRFREKLKANFGSVSTTRTVWMNLPPAFVYRAVR